MWMWLGGCEYGCVMWMSDWVDVDCGCGMGGCGCECG